MKIHQLSIDDALKSVGSTGRGLRIAYCKGALESVLPLCSRIGFCGKVAGLDAGISKTIRQAEAEMAAKGLRVLALASKPLSGAEITEELEQNLIFQGLVGFEDSLRAEVPGAIRRCHEAGIKVIMVTGDHPLTAVAVAREIGLIRTAQPQVITGKQVQQISDIALKIALDADEIVFARVTPEQKMRIVKALMAKKHIVAVTGDGVNDAPALKAAHIGIAMGVAGTDVAREASDMVLIDDNFASIVSAVEEGRAVSQNIRKFLSYVLVHNVAELVPYLVFVLFKIPLPLTPIQILFVDMGTDSLTALGLGIEPPDPQSMRLPPRPHDERLLNLPLALRAYLFLGPSVFWRRGAMGPITIIFGCLRSRPTTCGFARTLRIGRSSERRASISLPRRFWSVCTSGDLARHLGSWSLLRRRA